MLKNFISFFRKKNFQIHDGKYKIVCSHHCKSLLVFVDFTIGNIIFTIFYFFVSFTIVIFSKFSISSQTILFHDCKCKIDRSHHCKSLLIFISFTIDYSIFINCSISSVFYHLKFWKVSIFFRNDRMNF